MTECRDVLVSDQFDSFFNGWLEFAGHDVPGVPSCDEWPARFTITRLGPVQTWYGVDRPVIRYRVCSDAFPTVGSMHPCSWIDGTSETWLPILRNDRGERVS